MTYHNRTKCHVSLDNTHTTPLLGTSALHAYKYIDESNLPRLEASSNAHVRKIHKLIRKARLASSEQTLVIYPDFEAFKHEDLPSDYQVVSPSEPEQSGPVVFMCESLLDIKPIRQFAKRNPRALYFVFIRLSALHIPLGIDIVVAPPRFTPRAQHRTIPQHLVVHAYRVLKFLLNNVHLKIQRVNYLVSYAIREFEARTHLHARYTLHLVNSDSITFRSDSVSPRDLHSQSIHTHVYTNQSATYVQIKLTLANIQHHVQVFYDLLAIPQ